MALLRSHFFFFLFFFFQMFLGSQSRRTPLQYRFRKMSKSQSLVMTLSDVNGIIYRPFVKGIGLESISATQFYDHRLPPELDDTLLPRHAGPDQTNSFQKPLSSPSLTLHSNIKMYRLCHLLLLLLICSLALRLPRKHPHAG